jgi:hypothetical protein
LVIASGFRTTSIRRCGAHELNAAGTRLKVGLKRRKGIPYREFEKRRGIKGGN